MNTITRPANSPWTQLQTELRDLAFLLDRRGSHVAADLAVTIAARIDELLADEPSDRESPRFYAGLKRLSGPKKDSL